MSSDNRTARRRIAGETPPSVSAPAPRPVRKPRLPRKPAATPPAPRAEPADKGPLLPPLRWLLPLLALAVAALVFGTVFAARGVAQYRSEHGIEASNAQAEAAASKAAETIFSYDYTALDQHLAASNALLTPAFRKQFDKIAPALTDLAPQRKIQIKAKSQDVAAMECGDNCSTSRASILVFLDQARLIGDSTTPTVFGNRIIVDMVNHNGTWLVNNIRAL